MDNNKKTVKEQFTERVNQLHKEELPRIDFSSNSAFIILYEKMLEIEKKLDGLKLVQK